MRILLVVDDYMPNSIKVAAKMMHELACEFIMQGHSVSVITPDSTISSILQHSKLDGVDIYHFRSGPIKNTSKIKRALNETLLSYHAWNYAKDFFKENKHDYIIFYSPSIFFGPLVYKLKKLWGVKSYLILRDFFPQWTIDNKILKKNSLITYYFKFFEKINYINADTIGVMSPKNLEWFRSYYKTDKPLEVLYNWTNLEKNEYIKDKYREKLQLKDKVVFFYGGNMGQAQDMMNLLRLAKNMSDEENAHFVFVGAGDEVEMIQDTIEKEKLSNITLLPAVNQIEFKQMLSEFDVGLFTLNKNHQTHNFPGKLLGYMAQDLAILGSINPHNDLKDIVQNYDAGFITINGQDDLLYKNAQKLLCEKRRKELSKNGKKLLKDKFLSSSAVNQILN